MKARRLPRGIYRRGDVLWIRLKSADGKLTPRPPASVTSRWRRRSWRSAGPKRRCSAISPHASSSRSPSTDLRQAWEPAHLKKTPSFKAPLVVEAFGGAKARDMTTEKVQEFLDRLKDDEGLSASSVNHYRTILNSIFNEAIRHGRYDANPVRAIHQFREPPGLHRFLSIEEFQLLLAECKDPELRTAILVLCMTTLRLRELLNRRWSEVRLDGPAPYVSVPHTKTGVPKRPLRFHGWPWKRSKGSPATAWTTMCSRPGRRRDGLQPEKAPPVGLREEFRQARAVARDGRRPDPRPSAYRTLRALDAGHPWRRGEEDNRPPVPRAGALPASLPRLPGPDRGPDRPGALQ